MRLPPASSIEHLYLASEQYPPVSFSAQMSLEGLTQASQRYPLFSHRASGPQSIAEAEMQQPAHLESQNVRDSPSWRYGCPEPFAAGAGGISGVSSHAGGQHDGLRHLSRQSAASGRVGQGHYMPVSSLYASLQPISDARGHAKGVSQVHSASPYPPPASSSSSMLSALTSSPVNVWAIPVDHLQQSIGASEHRAGHHQCASGHGAQSVTGDPRESRVDDNTVSSHGWRGGAQSSALLRALQASQPQRTRRARLGTEATAGAQPNSEGAKAEESRQLSRCAPSAQDCDVPFIPKASVHLAPCLSMPGDLATRTLWCTGSRHCSASTPRMPSIP